MQQLNRVGLWRELPDAEVWDRAVCAVITLNVSTLFDEMLTFWTVLPQAVNVSRDAQLRIRIPLGGLIVTLLPTLW